MAHWGQAARGPTVGRRRHAQDDARRVNATAKEAGAHHPERAAQFQSLAAPQEALRAAGSASISVETQQNERLGDCKHAGQLWGQHPLEVNVPDCPGEARGRAGPYGLYDLQPNEGAVSVGLSAAPPEVAVTTIGPWWEDHGRMGYPRGPALLSLAAGGGRKGGRAWVWKAPLPSQRSDRLGLRVTGGHEPTGGSKWTPLEPRLFSPSSLTWAGQPWRTVETRLGYRRDTTTTTGLRVTARLRAGVYQPGKRLADAVMNTRQVEHHAVCPPWHSTSHPRWDDAPAP